MALRINTNVASVFAQKNLSRTQDRLQSNFEHLSSGLRITKAADDAAGLGVSENMRATIRSLRQAIRNANDGVSVVQTAEGAATEIGSILSRMRELAIQSASEVLGATERAYISTEATALISEVSRIADAAEFNGIALANAVGNSLDVWVGAGNSSSVDMLQVGLATLTTASLGISAVNLNTTTGAQAAIATLDTAIDSVNSAHASYGASQNRLSSALHNLEDYTENLVSAESRIRDVDFASETADLTRNQIFSQAAVAVLAQANQTPQAALQLLQ